MKTFVPEIWVEALRRSLISSLSPAAVTALCVQHERKQRVQHLKRRNTRTRRRRRAAIKRGKRQ